MFGDKGLFCDDCRQREGTLGKWRVCEKGGGGGVGWGRGATMGHYWQLSLSADSVMGGNISLKKIQSVCCSVFADWLFIFLRSLKPTASCRHNFCCTNQQLNESVFEEGVKVDLWLPKYAEVLLQTDRQTDSLLHTAPLLCVPATQTRLRLLWLTWLWSVNTAKINPKIIKKIKTKRDLKHTFLHHHCSNSIILKPHQQPPSLLCDRPHAEKTHNLVHLLLGRRNQAIICHLPVEDSRDLVLKCRPGSQTRRAGLSRCPRLMYRGLLI